MNENYSVKPFNEFVFGFFFPKEGVEFLFLFYSKVSTLQKVGDLLSFYQAKSTSGNTLVPQLVLVSSVTSYLSGLLA